MRGIGELICIVPHCENEATLKSDWQYGAEEVNTYPTHCICHTYTHRWRVVEYSNAYSLIRCLTCDEEERIEVSRDCKQIDSIYLTKIHYDKNEPIKKDK